MLSCSMYTMCIAYICNSEYSCSLASDRRTRPRVILILSTRAYSLAKIMEAEHPEENSIRQYEVFEATSNQKYIMTMDDRKEDIPKKKGGR